MKHEDHNYLKYFIYLSQVCVCWKLDYLLFCPSVYNISWNKESQIFVMQRLRPKQIRHVFKFMQIKGDSNKCPVWIWTEATNVSTPQSLLERFWCANDFLHKIATPSCIACSVLCHDINYAKDLMFWHWTIYITQCRSIGARLVA